MLLFFVLFMVFIVWLMDIVYEDVKDRTCKISWDTTKPNGTPRKLCELTKLGKLGWKAKIGLKEGIKLSYDDFLHGTVRK